ncbi:MAG TPA: DUF3545 family protein [Xanthomonadales bacterium]|nr:DUF3545 family protein [Xanthomonadales bacterium]
MGTQDSKQKNRSWRDIESLREKKRLRDDLLDIWDEGLDIDESEILGDDSDIDKYSDEEDIEVEDDPDDYDDDENYDDED